MSAAHAPGPQAGIALALRIGQHVRHRDYNGKRVTGTVRGISVDDRGLQADIVLDAPIVIPARSADDREISIWHQHVPAHDLTPFDDRDELIAEMLAALRISERALSALSHPDCAADSDGPLYSARAAIAKATGAAS